MHLKFTLFDPPTTRKPAYCSTRVLGRLIVFLVLLFSSFISQKSKAQSISLSVKKAPLESVFKSITKQSGYMFFYNYRLLEKSSPVVLNLKNVTLAEALDACFRNQPFTYSIQGKQITVVEKRIQKTDSAPVRDVTVTGIVTDSVGTVLSGITVTIKGSIQKVFTDGSGHFSIVAAVGSVLQLSSVNFNVKEVFVNGKDNDIKLVLSPKVVRLSEVTISTGYQTLRQSTIAGATSSIKASELYFDGTNTLEQALQGKLPGVVITNQSGLVGTRQKTTVRGTSTLLGNQDPIWVVDGIIQEDPLPFKATQLSSLGEITKDNYDYIRDFVGNSIKWLNPRDIDEITVLKDASSTAIYGVRAANGVIVITTKKGRVGPPIVNYSISVNTSAKVNYDRLNLMNSKERMTVSEEIYNRRLNGSGPSSTIGFSGALNDYLFKRTTYDEFNAQVRYLETVNTDWFNLLFRNPLSTSQNLGISGGNANTRYYSSFSYTSTDGTAIGNQARGVTGSFNVSSQISERLNVSVRLSASSNTTDGFYRVNPYAYASQISRVIPAYDASGSLFYYRNYNSNPGINGGAGAYLFNIINELDNSGSSNKNLSANTNFTLNYRVLDGLTFQSIYSLSNSSVNGNSYLTERSAAIAAKRMYDFGTVKPTDAAYLSSGLPIGGEYNDYSNQNRAWNWRNSLSYTKLLNQKHAITILLGQEFNSSNYTGVSATTYGYLRDRGKTFAPVPITFGAGTTQFPNSNILNLQNRALTDRTVNNIGIYGTLNYAYDNRYVVNFSIRNDRSNRFGQFTEEKFNPVLAGGLRWNIAREKWFDRTNWLSDLSVRASLGYQRNVVSSVSPDLILRIPSGAITSASVTDTFTGDYLLTISSLPYADLRFEKTISMNLGLDFSLFQNKIMGSINYYEKRSKDLVTFLQVPVEFGVLNAPINGGSLTNRGFEVSASFVPVRTKDFTWSVSMNTAKNFNKLNKTGIAQNLTWRTAVSGNLNKQGYPISGLWAFDFTGINPANGSPLFNLQVADNSDPLTDPASYLKYVGKLDPDFTGGIGTNFRYRKLTLTSGFNLQVGGKKFLAPAYNLTYGIPSEYDNLSKDLLNRWTPTNITGKFPGLPNGSSVQLPDGKTINTYEMYNNSTDRVVNASALRCNYISLSYMLPARVVNWIKSKNVNIGAGVSNPFAIVSKDFRGVDPEVATGAQPRVRSYSLNLNASF